MLARIYDGERRPLSGHAPAVETEARETPKRQAEKPRRWLLFWKRK